MIGGVDGQEHLQYASGRWCAQLLSKENSCVICTLFPEPCFDLLPCVLHRLRNASQDQKQDTVSY